LLFTFLKYLQPAHYFRLFKNDGASIFPIIDSLPIHISNQLIKDDTYTSDLAKTYDLSWQAIQKGYIGSAPCYTSFDKLPLVDEYRFVRKNFNKIWVFYILFLRLLSFKNPLKELKCILESRNCKRINYSSTPITYEDYSSFKSDLLNSQPLISVVIPTLNRYKYLKDVLIDLEQQDYKNFEVIIVDQTEDFKEHFYKGWDLDMTFWYQEEKALWRARNEAIIAAKGDYILLYDDDSLVEPDWITQHIKALDYFKADLSSGVSISTVGAKVPENYGYFRVSDQLDTGNVLLKKSVFKEIGLFDRQYEKQRMGDGEYGLRSYLNGYLNVSNPYAKRIHLKVGTGGLRQMGSWDGFRPKNWFGPRPVPSVLYQFRKYYGNKIALFAILKTVPPSIIPYRFKGNKMMLLLGVLFSIIIAPLIVFQVCKSWKLASLKLKEGGLIDSLV
jgi:glycosyltransferase involved in cell wall biosynthesis